MDWNGNLIFENLLLAYQGPAADNTMHAHASLQITISRQDSIQLVDHQGQIHCGSVLYVRPGTQHQLQPSEHIVLLLIEPQSDLARALSDGFGDDDIGQLTGPYSQIFGATQSLSDLVTRIGSLANFDTLDSRLSNALNFLASAPLGNAVKNAASHCGLSEPRLRAIALKQLGVPLSKFLLWKAVGRAGRALLAGNSLADSAVIGGFSDQAHYTRTMRKLMGITPGQAQHSAV
ncbi:MAG: helix-turn-helix domain-containing protein [Pseudomonadales bacterium]